VTLLVLYDLIDESQGRQVDTVIPWLGLGGGVIHVEESLDSVERHTAQWDLPPGTATWYLD
jgi:hypothetical protein